jgi:hypothetical protein
VWLRPSSPLPPSTPFPTPLSFSTPHGLTSIEPWASRGRFERPATTMTRVLAWSRPPKGEESLIHPNRLRAPALRDGMPRAVARRQPARRLAAQLTVGALAWNDEIHRCRFLPPNLRDPSALRGLTHGAERGDVGYPSHGYGGGHDNIDDHSWNPCKDISSFHLWALSIQCKGHK